MGIEAWLGEEIKLGCKQKLGASFLSYEFSRSLRELHPSSQYI